MGIVFSKPKQFIIKKLIKMAKEKMPDAERFSYLNSCKNLQLWEDIEKLKENKSRCNTNRSIYIIYDNDSLNDILELIRHLADNTMIIAIELLDAILLLESMNEVMPTQNGPPIPMRKNEEMLFLASAPKKYVFEAIWDELQNRSLSPRSQLRSPSPTGEFIEMGDRKGKGPAYT